MNTSSTATSTPANNAPLAPTAAESQQSQQPEPAQPPKPVKKPVLLYLCSVQDKDEDFDEILNQYAATYNLSNNLEIGDLDTNGFLNLLTFVVEYLTGQNFCNCPLSRLLVDYIVNGLKDKLLILPRIIRCYLDKIKRNFVVMEKIQEGKRPECHSDTPSDFVYVLQRVVGDQTRYYMMIEVGVDRATIPNSFLSDQNSRQVKMKFVGNNLIKDGNGESVVAAAKIRQGIRDFLETNNIVYPQETPHLGIYMQNPVENSVPLSKLTGMKYKADQIPIMNNLKNVFVLLPPMKYEGPLKNGFNQTVSSSAWKSLCMFISKYVDSIDLENLDMPQKVSLTDEENKIYASIHLANSSESLPENIRKYKTIMVAYPVGLDFTDEICRYAEGLVGSHTRSTFKLQSDSDAFVINKWSTTEVSAPPKKSLKKQKVVKRLSIGKDPVPHKRRAHE